MFDAIGEGLLQLLQPDSLIFLLVGVLVGAITGLLPGLGGSVGMALLLPFIYGMEPRQAIAMLIGIMAVNNTSDTFTSILLGVPGSSASQATIMDGYPLTKKGEGARALGAALTGSMVGGIIGAIALVALIPLARPLVLSLGSPELFLLTLVGICAVAVLVGGKPIEGLLATLFGMMLGMVGPSVAGHRFMVFNWDYLFTGLALVILVIGMFAVPEILTLLRERTSLSRTGELSPGGLRRGIRDVFQHKGLVAGSSVGAVGMAIVPGMNGTAVSWLIYSLTKRFSKNNKNFGKGDIRGVIAPDSANNAMEGGAIVPTLLFGIPSGASSAILLAGVILVGIDPGRDMVSPTNLPVLLVVAWSLALANVLATALCLGASRYFARLSVVPPQLLVPAIVLVVIFAAFQTSQKWGDIIILVALGALGFLLARWGWPRPPLLIGFVVGPNMENYLRLSVDRYHWAWLEDPQVIGIGCAIILVMAAAIVLGRRQKGQVVAEVTELLEPAPPVGASVPAAPSDAATPKVSPVTGKRLAAPDAQVTTGGSAESSTPAAVDELVPDSGGTSTMLREASTLYWVSWGFGLLALCAFTGFVVAGAVWLTAFLRYEGKLRWLSLVLYVGAFVVLVLALEHTIGVTLPPPAWGPFA